MNADDLRDRLLAAVADAADVAALEQVRVDALGKKGALTQQLKALGGLPPDERRAAGQALNAVRDAISAALESRKAALEAAALAAKLATEREDVTLPVRPEARGKIHPTSQVLAELVAIFGAMDFTLAEGPEVEDDFHNFTALNIPPEHPARQMHDTFYLQAGADGGAMNVLRTHTSNVQIRTMQSQSPPLRIIAPGRTYRSDSDQTHTPMFHQVEGLVIEPGIHMGHLKGVVQTFVQAFFEVEHVPVRFRPSFFPFTEPSAEIDVGCSWQDGTLKIGDGDDWLEIAGSGMVHPNVLRACGLDPAQWQGFAFGMGVERLAMLKYGIPDIRLLFEPDTRWLSHYGFDFLDVPTLTGGLSR